MHYKTTASAFKAWMLNLEARFPVLFALLGMRKVHGILRSLVSIFLWVRVCILSVLIVLLRSLHSGGRVGNVVVIATRNDFLGPCVIEILSLLHERGDREGYLTVENIHNFNRINSAYMAHAGISRVRGILIQDSLPALVKICDAKTHIAFENVFETVGAVVMKRLGRQEKAILKVPDGVVTKTTGNLRPSDRPLKGDFKQRLTSPATSAVTYVVQPGVDGYRVALNGCVPSPSLLRPVGMPRFLRADRLRDQQERPVVLPSLAERLQRDDRSIKILVALTKNRKASDLEWFCEQLELKFEELEDLLERSSASLWFKEHQRTVDGTNFNYCGFTSGLPEGIHYVAPEEGLSSVDLGPLFNSLLTDISSIYVDLLPFDKPIGFVAFERWQRSGSFCYPELPFYPGEKLNGGDDLKRFIRARAEDSDPWKSERACARKVLLGTGVDKAFWRQVI